jgi:hypothetical protein
LNNFPNFAKTQTVWAMEITIEIVNENAVGLLQYLEKLNLIRLVEPKKISNSNPDTQRKSRFAGRISPEIADDLHKQLQKSRREW